MKSQNGKAPDTIAGDLNKLQRIFRHFVDRETIAANPLKHPSVKELRPQTVKHERCFTNAELACLMDEARKPWQSLQAEDFVDVFTLLAQSGLHIGEALHLRWCDIAFGREEGVIFGCSPGEKGGQKRKRAFARTQSVHDSSGVYRFPAEKESPVSTR